MKTELDVHLYRGSLVRGSATFSDDHLYRYELIRMWGVGERVALFIGLNPSIADARWEDPTLRRCMTFAKDWGYGGVVMLNAYAYISSHSGPLKRVADPIGPENDMFMGKWSGKLRDIPLFVAGWGTQIDENRQKEIRRIFPKLNFLRLTKDGFPSHPLYLPKTLRPQLWI